jgi:hypothetical protein
MDNQKIYRDIYKICGGEILDYYGACSITTFLNNGVIINEQYYGNICTYCTKK